MQLERIPTGQEMEALIGPEQYRAWTNLCAAIDARYDVDRQWNKGHKPWTYEYKYSRGGKTLCGLYAKEGYAGFLVIFGKKEQAKFEMERDTYPACITEIYDATKVYFDGRWAMFPVAEDAPFDDYLRLLAIKRRPNRK